MPADSSPLPKMLKPTFFISLWVGFCLFIGATLGLYSETPLPILIGLAIIGLLVFLAMDLALYAMLVCWPFSFRYILPSELEVQTPTEPLLGMLVFAFVIKQILDIVIRRGEAGEVRHAFPFRMPVIFYAAAMLLPTLNSPQVLVSAKGSMRAITYMMLSFVVYDIVRKRRDLRRLFVATFPAAIVVVGWTMVVLIYRIDRWQWTSAYYGSPFTNYSAYGAFTATFLLITLSRLLSDRTAYDRVLWTGLLMIFGGGLILCFSRGVWLSVIVALGFLFIYSGTGEQGNRIIFIAFGGIFLLIILSLPGVSGLIFERISTLFNFQFASNRSRLLRWGQAFLMFLQHPIIGNGYGAFAMLYEEKVALVGAYTAQFQLGAHSEYLQVLAELGLIGFAAWMWVIFAFLQHGWQALQQIHGGFYRSVIVGLMAAELAMLVLFIVFSMPSGDEIAIPFWLIYGVLPAVVKMANQREVMG
jgi:O-antigen ligase